MEPIGELGGDEGRARGPSPGDGAVLSGQAGAPDMVGAPANTLRDCRGYGAPVASARRSRLLRARAWLLGLAALWLVLFAVAHLLWYR